MSMGVLLLKLSTFYSRASFAGQYLNLYPEQAYTQAGNKLG
jgi:hypothetical protein